MNEFTGPITADDRDLLLAYLKASGIDGRFSHRQCAEIGYRVGRAVEREEMEKVRAMVKKVLAEKTLKHWFLDRLGFCWDRNGFWYQDSYGSTHVMKWPWVKRFT